MHNGGHFAIVRDLVSVRCGGYLSCRIHHQPHSPISRVLSGILRFDEGDTGSAVVQPSIRVGKRLVVQRGNEGGLPILHLAVLPGYHRHGEPPSVQVPRGPLRPSIGEQGLNLLFTVADDAFAFHDELAVVARQRQQDRSVVLHLVVRLRHRLLEGLFRQVAHALQHRAASAVFLFVLVYRQAGVAGDHQAGMGDVYRSARKHVVHRDAERRVGQTETQNGAVGLERRRLTGAHPQAKRCQSIPLGLMHGAFAQHNLAVADLNEHRGRGLKAQGQLNLVPPRGGKRLNALDAYGLTGRCEYPPHFAHAVHGSGNASPVGAEYPQVALRLPRCGQRMPPALPVRFAHPCLQLHRLGWRWRGSKAQAQFGQSASFQPVQADGASCLCGSRDDVDAVAVRG